MNVAHYNAVVEDGEKGNKIIGLYTGESSVIPVPNVRINEDTYERLIAEGANSFRIINGIVQRIATKPINKKAEVVIKRKAVAKSRITEQLVVGKHTYAMSSVLQANLVLNLAICACDEDHICSINTIKDDKKVSVEHDKEMLLAVARAFNTRRQVISKQVQNL